MDEDDDREALELDGAEGEGGGQILRTALSLSVLARRPVRITNIRAGRKNPGLQRQHFTAVAALAKASNAKTSGLSVGSPTLEFNPQETDGGNFSFDIGTAGSVVLVAQTLLPALLHAHQKSTVTITGGTHVPFAPTFDYFARVFLPALNRMGIRADAQLVQSGFYPAGGGKIILTVEPMPRSQKLAAFAFLTPVRGEKPWAVIRSSQLPPHVNEREQQEVAKRLPGASIQSENRPGNSPGNAVTLGQGFLGASALGEQGKPAEKVAEEAINAFEQETKAGAVVDRHLADQLMLYACLAQGESRLKTSTITPHAHTNASVLKKFVSRSINFEGNTIIIR